jgi:hypothetical protein
MALACEVCAIDPVTRSWAAGKPNVASFPEGFDYEGQWCQTACFYHRNVLDMPPPDDWKPRRNNGGPSDSFMMDFENDVLRDFDGGYVPKNKNRHTDSRWAALVRRNVDPHHTDVTWAEYAEFVSNGGGDQWFMEEKAEEPSTGPALQLAALSTVFEQLQGSETRNLKRKLAETTLEREDFRQGNASVGHMTWRQHVHHLQAEVEELEHDARTLREEGRQLRNMIRRLRAHMLKEDVIAGLEPP